MYKDFYGLKESPFDLTPSPRFVYLGESHKKAMALLTYGVKERKAFILLTGEVGTGKTTMVKKLFHDLNATVHCVYISNPLLSLRDFFNTLAFSAFKRRIHFKSQRDFFAAFEPFLLKCREERHYFILVVDESQNLSFELLQALAPFSQMEFADEKLMSIFLVGQTELNEKLGDPRCADIQGKIGSRYNIPPLDLRATREYIDTRMRIAGARQGKALFSKDAVEAIFTYSEGYPRMINTLADNALLLGYTKEKRKITGDLVRKSFQDMGLKTTPSKRKGVATGIPIPRGKKKRSTRAYWMGALALIVLIGAILAASTNNPLREFLYNRLSPVEESLEPAAQRPVPGRNFVKKKIVRTYDKVAIPIPQPQQILQTTPVVVPEQIEPQGSGFAEEEAEALQVVSQAPGGEITDRVESIELKEVVICQDVLDRRPIGKGDLFKLGIGKLYCFNRITLQQPPPTEVTHIWYRENIEMSRVTLPVKSYHWRTYSLRRLLPQDIGSWHVEIRSPDETILATVAFTVIP